MQLMRRFLRRSPGDQCLIATVAGAATVVHLLLRVAPYRRVDRALARVSRLLIKVRPLRSVRPARLLWAVEAVGRSVPEFACLPQALTGRVLLAAHGWSSEIRFGVQPRRAGALQAHAWLEREGQTLIGGAPLSPYEPLLKSHARRQ
jgi:hypothetical protein